MLQTIKMSWILRVIAAHYFGNLRASGSNANTATCISIKSLLSHERVAFILFQRCHLGNQTCASDYRWLCLTQDLLPKLSETTSPPWNPCVTSYCVCMGSCSTAKWCRRLAEKMTWESSWEIPGWVSHLASVFGPFCNLSGWYLTVVIREVEVGFPPL